MKHTAVPFVRTNLRGVPTRTLDGTGGMTKDKNPIEKWDTSEWTPEGRREVERELARRKKARNKRQNRL